MNKFVFFLSARYIPKATKYHCLDYGKYLVAQMVKNLTTMQENWVQSLGWEDPLKKVMATHSNILAWRISWTEENGKLQSMRSQRVRHD